MSSTGSFKLLSMADITRRIPSTPPLDEGKKKSRKSKGEKPTMFYSLSLLSRKGTLGTLWIAAYCFKKLKKGQIASTDISSTVDKIIPEIQISHRVLAQLLLGIAKIYSKKVDYLYDDCNETLEQIKRFLPLSQNVTQYKASYKQKNDISGKKEVNSVMYQGAKSVKENATEQIETMLDSYSKQFELDLMVSEERVHGGNHQLSTPQDEWKDDESSKPSCLIEQLIANEVPNISGFMPYTPLTDILPPLELNESQNSGHVPYEQTIPSIEEKNPSAGEQRSPEGMTNLLAGETSKRVTSPKMMLSTPTIRETSRILRKRKKAYDESIILSNKIMKQSIHDAGDLICKRRKLPQTDLDIWKFWKFLKTSQIFEDPLILFSISEPRELLQSKLCQPQRKSRSSRKSVDKPIDLTNLKDGMIDDVLMLKREETPHYSAKESEGRYMDSASIKDIMPCTITDSGGIHNYTSNMEDRLPSVITETKSLLQEDRNCPTGHISLEISNKGICLPDAPDNQSEKIEFCFIGMDSDVEAKHLNNENKWSPSMRATAHYILNRFLRIREQNQESVLSLGQLLEGNTRTTCARLFYELLSLKTFGCIDVRQDIPYEDVAISATPELIFTKVSFVEV